MVFPFTIRVLFYNTFTYILFPQQTELYRPLLKYTHFHILKEINASKEQISSIESQLASTISTEELNSLKTKVNQNLEQHRRDTENRKRLKFIRDAEDYQRDRVYKWRDFSSTRRGPGQLGHSSTDLSSSGSELDRPDHPSTSTHFLGFRKKYNRRRGGRGEAAPTGSDRNFIRVTCSQIQS
ncbi:uncharacterized protein [Phyllobates terribilis]|uniref:uncharacterized protein isoform X2 n=1 Tax=Phyllobates terribilis TaxID=111132 RepID=UPI003CCB47EA